MKGNKGCRSRSRDLQKSTGTGNGDRLSKLPNDVLVNILERVGTLDALRTCVLSKRMLKLPAMLSRIIVDYYSVLPDEDDDRVIHMRDLVRLNGVVADVTDKILSTRSPQIPIRRLKVRFILRRYDCLSIGKSVAHAMATQKLGAVEFKILTEKPPDNCTHDDLLYFAKQFNIFLGDCPDAFAGLTKLHLQNLRFAVSDISNILATCKRLETLRFFECDAGIRSVVQVEHARLVELEIMYGEFGMVELSCVPRLQRMSYDSWGCHDELPLFLGFVPQLSKLTLINTCFSDKTVQLSQLLANVPSISDLHLQFESEKIWVRPERPKLLAPVLDKLRFVNLVNLPEECDISWTMFILEAAPSVEELCITLWDHWCQMKTHYGYCEKTDGRWKPSASDFRHENLTKLTIYGFQPDDNFMWYVRRLMTAAVNMEEISLHDRKVCEVCEYDREIKVRPSRYPRTDDEKEKFLEALGMASSAVIHFRS